MGMSVAARSLRQTDDREEQPVRIKTIYLRFYKSFNYDHLRKSDSNSVPDPWDSVDERFFPYVRIPLEKDITTVVGANESGKTQVLDAIECLLSGENILHKDFCRYSEFFVVGKEMRKPEFGGEFHALDEDEKANLRRVLKLDANHPADSFHLFRAHEATTVYVKVDGEWKTHTPTTKQVESLGLPPFFRVEANVALPDSVPLDYLISAGKTTGVSRKRRLGWIERVMSKAAVFQDKSTVTASAEEISADFRLIDDTGDDATKALKSLELADTLLVKVAGINRKSFEGVRKAVRSGDEGYANGLVDGMNERLAASLDFPKWWTQDQEFALRLTLRDSNLVFTVKDRTGRDYSFSERSGGLQHFLSYFVRYLAHDFQNRNEVLLMDEPDAFLSMLGQQDLLRIFAAFAHPQDPEKPGVQVVYVTHSPFLIDKNHAERIRVLEKAEGEDGTRTVANAGHNHYEPLRTAFGSFVAETTFIGNCNLLVEGQADQVLLAGMSALSRKHTPTAENLDLNTLTLVPAGGAKHIPYLAYLARGRSVDTPAVVVLVDGDDAGKEAVEELQDGYRGRQLVTNDLIITVDQSLGFPSETGTSPVEPEDLITQAVVRRAVILAAAEKLNPEAAHEFEEALGDTSPTGGQKVFKAAAMAASAVKQQNGRGFELTKVGFARGVLAALQENGLANERAETLDNFAVLFGRINTAQRAAMRAHAHTKTSTLLKQQLKNFKRDYPHSATRRAAVALLDNIRAQLPANAIETQHVRDHITSIQDKFNLSTEPGATIVNYEQFLSDVEDLPNRFVRKLEQPTTDAMTIEAALP